MSRILEYLTVSCISDSVEAAIYTCGEIPDMSRRSWVLPTCQSLFLILACYWIIFCCVSARPQDRMSVSTVLSDFQLWTHSRPLHFVAKAREGRKKLLEEEYWIMRPTASCSCRKGIKPKQSSGYGELHISQPLSDNVPLIYVVIILKDIDHSTLSNNLVNFSPKVWQAGSFI